MKQLLNLSVNPNPGHMMSDWQAAAELLTLTGLDGYEVGPYGRMLPGQVPAEIVGGVHLSFFPYLHHIWHEDTDAMIAIWGDMDRAQAMMGVTTRSQLIEHYRYQFELAASWGAPYVVFHPVLCDSEAIFTQKFPWRWQEVAHLCAQVLNAAMQTTSFTGRLLFENLWWQQSFRLERRDEYDLLKSLVNYHNTGICFDTGHMMACHTGLINQCAGVAYLSKRLQALDLWSEIHTVHLNASLGGKHLLPDNALRQFNRLAESREPETRLGLILEHVCNIDPHLPFSTPAIAPLIDRIAPEILVHELRQSTMPQWQDYIHTQTQSLAGQWPQSPSLLQTA